MSSRQERIDYLERELTYWRCQKRMAEGTIRAAGQKIEGYEQELAALRGYRPNVRMLALVGGRDDA